MILDILEQSKKYYCLNDKFKEAFEFIDKAFSENIAVGKYEIDGKELYASVQEYNTKQEEDCKFEGHRKYIDIQVIMSGTEVMDVVDISLAELNSDYNEQKDVEFYKNTELASRAIVKKGEYAIFMPNDIHKPSMAHKESETVKKIVVKVKI